MNERCILILKRIASNNGFIKIADLAKEFNVSPRTIRYDLEEIDFF